MSKFTKRWITSVAEDSETAVDKHPAQQSSQYAARTQDALMMTPNPSGGRISAGDSKSSSNCISADEIVCKPPMRMYVLGRCGSGKTKFVEYFVNVNRDKWNKVIVLTASTRFNTDYCNIIGVTRLDANKERDIIKLKKIVKLQEKFREKGYEYHTLIIIDDFIGTMNLHRGALATYFEKMATMGRHFNLSLIFCSQKFARLSTAVREQMGSFVIFKLLRTEIENQVALLQGDYPKHQFYDVYQELTKRRHSALYIQDVDPYSPGVVGLHPVDLDRFQALLDPEDDPEAEGPDPESTE